MYAESINMMFREIKMLLCNFSCQMINVKETLNFKYLALNTPLIHTLFTYSKLNMDDFSVLTGLLGSLDSAQEEELKSLHWHVCY